MASRTKMDVSFCSYDNKAHINKLCMKQKHAYKGVISEQLHVLKLYIESHCYYVDNFVYIHCVSKNNTDFAHYDFSAHLPILVILTELLPREYAIKR